MPDLLTQRSPIVTGLALAVAGGGLGYAGRSGGLVIGEHAMAIHAARLAQLADRGNDACAATAPS